MESQQIHRRLPEEIIVEILSRLSVKSILRFKCVSKSWRSLISTKHFVKTHLENSKKNKTFSHHKIISSCGQSPDTLKGLSLHSLLIKPEAHAFPLDFPTNYSSKGLFFLGSCNGLICILVDIYDFLLWNPSTREFKELPDFFTGVKHTQRYIITRYGFGFDESSGDYKVYAAFCIVSDNREIYYIGRMYSLKADSWGGEELPTCTPPSFDTLFESGKFVSGKLHWITISPSTLKWEIICLDLKSETFGSVEPPTFSQEDLFFTKLVTKLVVLDGCLCVSCHYLTTTPDKCKFDIWIWKEYGVEDSWSKLLTISSLSESSKTSLTILPRLTTLITLPNGEVLFSYGSVFVIWNPKDNLFRQCYVVDFDHVYDQARVYSESLVSLSP